ncbi:hypothetical protein [Rivularia sp. PCC 7116]|uniref:hypothetical protein n=1 Tax=Rivularia sp. PCC 7116 TaxID=373994 RepID=UPI0002D6F01A|nr:hypothetical protein [Rivularia sp. PCC 7116]
MSFVIKGLFIMRNVNREQLDNQENSYRFYKYSSASSQYNIWENDIDTFYIIEKPNKLILGRKTNNAKFSGNEIFLCILILVMLLVGFGGQSWIKNRTRQKLIYSVSQSIEVHTKPHPQPLSLIRRGEIKQSFIGVR